MTTPARAMRPVMLLFALGLAPCMTAMAQQMPITGRMMDGQPAAHAPASAPATSMPDDATGQATPPPPPDAASRDMATAAAPGPTARDEPVAIGQVTRQLLRMQVDGSHAGRRLPMLGDEASAAYRRYIDSFSHPIPEFFETTVGKDGSLGR